MLDLTFGEQVKIVLSRKGMTIKELAEIIESKTGKKMSRQNLTQRLGRDNFQEQDMRMIAEILECPFQLNILNEDDSIESNYNNKEEAMVLKKRQKVADKKTAKEHVAEPKEAKQEAEPEESVLEEVAREREESQNLEAEPVVEVVEVSTEPEQTEPAKEVAEPVAEPEYVQEYAQEPAPEYSETYEEVAPEYQQEDIGVVETPEPVVTEEPVAAPVEEHTESQPVEQKEEKKEEEKPKRGWFANFRRRGKEDKAAKETKAEEVKAEPVKEPEEPYYAPENDMVQSEQSMDQFQDNGSYLNSLVQEASAQNDWYPQVEEAYREEVEAVEAVPADEEDLERGEINPYTGREYQTNSVRVHPKKIGYVQVYNRGIHAWEEMTEWAFLGYQEQKKAELGKAYEEPIYLD